MIKYKKGYKYQLIEDYTVNTGIVVVDLIHTNYISLVYGKLTVKAGYAWDGPSFPAIDTLNFMRGSLVHDAFYQLMRESHLDREIHRDMADRLLQTMCLEDGMSQIRAFVVYWALRWFGYWATTETAGKPIVCAPGGEC